DYPSNPFHQNPFDNQGSFAKLKHEYLGDFPKGAKQIRQRCVNKLFSQVITHIESKDKSMILNLCVEYNHAWGKISHHTYTNLFNKQNYYSNNSIKNLFQACRYKSITLSIDNNSASIQPPKKKAKISKATLSNISPFSEEEFNDTLNLLSEDLEQKTLPNTSPFSEEDFDHVLNILSED
ncbi:MAG: hypothetical protein V4489_07880, partial [Chlamydiota bacterium]